MVTSFKSSLDEKLKRIIVWFLLGTTFFTPLYAPAGRVLLLAAIVLALVHGGRQNSRLKFNPIYWPIAGFAIWSLLSISNAPSPWLSLYNWTFYVGAYISIYILTVLYIDTEKMRSLMVYTMIGAALCVVGYGLYQYSFLTNIDNLHWVDPGAFPLLRRRMYSTLLNPNLLGAYLLIIIGMVAPRFFVVKERKEKAVYFFINALLFLCLLLTYSRGIWLSFLAMVLFWTVTLERKLFYTLLFIPLVLFFYHGEIATRLWSLFHTSDTSVALRYALWDSTCYMIKEYPFLGIGWGSFLETYPSYNYFIQSEHIQIYHAHNFYLHIAAEVGLIGLFFYLALIVRHGRWALSALLKYPDDAFFYSIIAILLGIMVSGIFDHDLFSYQVAFVFWQSLALLQAKLSNKERESTLK